MELHKDTQIFWNVLYFREYLLFFDNPTKVYSKKKKKSGGGGEEEVELL